MYDGFAGEAQVDGVFVQISVRTASGPDPDLVLAQRALRLLPDG
jgi:hypothetical protein